MDDRRLLLAAALGVFSSAVLLLARRERRRAVPGGGCVVETVETTAATWMPEATLVAVLSLLIDALGPKETCRLRCLCPSAIVSHQELRQVFEGWTEELCLAKLATSEVSDVPAALRRAVAVAALAGRSPDLWLPDTLGRPALVVAACSRPKAKSQELLKALLSQKAQPEARSPDGWNALMWSAQRGNCEDCRLLLQARANTNAVSADGTSPLLCAVRADVAPLQVVKLLLSSRADPALVPMQSPFDEYVDMDVREALASAPKQR